MLRSCALAAFFSALHDERNAAFPLGESESLGSRPKLVGVSQHGEPLEQGVFHVRST